MKPSEVSRRLSVLFQHREPVLLAGSPGVGKSDLVSQACEPELISATIRAIAQNGGHDA